MHKDNSVNCSNFSDSRKRNRVKSNAWACTVHSIILSIILHNDDVLSTRQSLECNNAKEEEK